MSNPRAGGRKFQSISDDLMTDLRGAFDEFDINKDELIDIKELGNLFKSGGIDVPGYKLREIIKEMDKDQDGKLNWLEFCSIVNDLKDKEVALTFKKSVTTREGIQRKGGTSSSAEGTTHSFSNEEKHAFAEWINTQLAKDPDCKDLLPIDPESESDLFDKVNNGIIFCKIINLSSPDTIDERAINKKKLNIYKATENQVLAINSANSIGCSTVNIGPDDLMKGTQHLVLGLMWQIIRIGLFANIDLVHNPGLYKLLRDGEELADLMKLSPEEILLRWVNYHLANSGSDKRITNFGQDIHDSEAYILLLNQIAPKDVGITCSALSEPDLKNRAEKMLQNADKIHCREFVSPSDVVKGNTKLNLAFVANLFNNYPGLECDDLEIEVIEETREEKTFRNWINSLGLKDTPFLNNLYSEMNNGLILLKLYDCVKPGIVDWDKRVNHPPSFNKLGGNMKKIENCNYAIELGQKMNFSLVGIDGNDINQGNQTFTLALVWQIMRAYTLSLLQKIAGTEEKDMEKYIINWVNEKLQSAEKTSTLTSFKDSSIANSVVVIDLIDAISPGIINYQYVLKADSLSPSERLENAKYAISMGRRIGARLYALPEDLVEVKHKMILTVFACLMVRGLQK